MSTVIVPQRMGVMQTVQHKHRIKIEGCQVQSVKTVEILPIDLDTLLPLALVADAVMPNPRLPDGSLSMG